ncbi:MAG TPA: alginate export family protein [Bacteroidales bacterium]|nr:alginate export family protein [Bacteroidales bacterium]
MKAYHIYSLSFLLNLAAIPLHAQLELSAEIRPRFELNHGFGNVLHVNDMAMAYFSQRTRLNVMHRSQGTDIYLSLQDVRVWGDDNLATRTAAQLNTSSLGIYQAWMSFRFGEGSFIRIGRQEFAYDDQRLLSARNWTQYAQTYDALLFSRSKNRWQADLALSYNNDATKIGTGFGNNFYLVDPIEQRIRTLNFLYLKRSVGKDTYLSGLAILSGYQKEKQSNVIYMMATIGGHFSMQKRFSDFKANYYIQRGKSQKGKDMHSFMATAEAGLKLARLRSGIGIDIISGNDATNSSFDYTSREHAFDLLYGVRFVRYGRLNQYVLPSSTSGGGWVDLYPSLSRQTKKYGTIAAEWHFFRLQRPVVNPLNANEILDGSLGSEIDLIWNYNIRSNLNLNAGFAWYWTNDRFAKVKAVSPDQLAHPWYGWLMLTYKPVLFKAEK